MNKDTWQNVMNYIPEEEALPLSRVNKVLNLAYNNQYGRFNDQKDNKKIARSTVDQLKSSIKKCNLDLVKFHLEYNYPLTIEDMILAIECNNINIILILLQKGCPIDSTCILKCLEKKNTDAIINLLLENGCPVDSTCMQESILRFRNNIFYTFLKYGYGYMIDTKTLIYIITSCKIDDIEVFLSYLDEDSELKNNPLYVNLSLSITDDKLAQDLSNLLISYGFRY